ncbi:hypothetical protein F4810DRAFT_574718 [Camillea tinctor]|nr:hypothetical protein F4810DRAFT_574718 [Camillea tinctor]
MPPRKTAVPRSGPPFSHKKGSQPTSGARAITSEWIDYGWSVALTRDITSRVERVQSEANSTYVLQIRRDRPVDAFSIRNSLFWQHRKLPDPRLVSTPGTDMFNFFAGDGRDGASDDPYHVTMLDVKRKTDRARPGCFVLHPLFRAMREREFLVWPVEFDGVDGGDNVWVTLVLRIKPQTATPSADREVLDMAVVDPLPAGRATRRALIQKRLPTILAQGCIALRAGVRVHDLGCPDVGAAWETGYVAYAVAAEMLRRLKVVSWRRARSGDGDQGCELVFGPWEEHYDVDAYRQNMLAACAHQTVERSEYRVRVALEVASDGSCYAPADLRHPRSENDVPDERYTFIYPRGEDAEDVVVCMQPREQESPAFVAAKNEGEEEEEVVVKQEPPEDEDYKLAALPVSSPDAPKPASLIIDLTDDEDDGKGEEEVPPPAPQTENSMTFADPVELGDDCEDDDEDDLVEAEPVILFGADESITDCKRPREDDNDDDGYQSGLSSKRARYESKIEIE